MYNQCYIILKIIHLNAVLSPLYWKKGECDVPRTWAWHGITFTLLAKIVCHVMPSPTHQKMWNYAKELANSLLFFWGIWNVLERICFRYSFWLLELNMKNSLELSRLLIRVLEGPVYSLVSTTLCRRILFYSNCHLFWVDVLIYVQLLAILDYFTD